MSQEGDEVKRIKEFQVWNRTFPWNLSKLTFLSEIGDRARYYARFSRSFRLLPGSRMDASRLKPECLQMRILSAMSWLMSSLSEIELDNGSAEALGNLGEIAEWHVDEFAMLIKVALQEDSMEVDIPFEYFERSLKLPSDCQETFFLWGPRQTGKSTLLKRTFPEAYRIDLLQPGVYRRYLQKPELIIEETRLKGYRFVVIDEIQKVPELLDAVHWLYEEMGVNFALCASSARKVRKGKANLLGGRGVTYELFGFSGKELGDAFDLERMLNHGAIPRIYLSNSPKRLLNTYVSQYLKEEIAAEGLVRRLPAFFEFLNAAALSDCEVVNYTQSLGIPAFQAKLFEGISKFLSTHYWDPFFMHTGEDRSEGFRENRRSAPERFTRTGSGSYGNPKAYRKTNDGIEILHYITFLHHLWSGLVF